MTAPTAANAAAPVQTAPPQYAAPAQAPATPPAAVATLPPTSGTLAAPPQGNAPIWGAPPAGAPAPAIATAPPQTAPPQSAPIQTAPIQITPVQAAPPQTAPAVATLPPGYPTQPAYPTAAPPAPAAAGTASLAPAANGVPLSTSVPAYAPAMPPPAPPILLAHPDVIDTAKMSANGLTVQLFGITGAGGPQAQGLKAYLTSAGDRLTCHAQPTNDYACMLPDGTDLAMVALVNGAAEARPDAPPAYKEQELAAQAARRGIWANLPPPPVPVHHPVVRNTAMLEGERATFALDGLEGVGEPYASQLQNYILTSGDTLSCQEQGVSEYYTCLSRDGTDLAKVVLVNGAAKATPDAPDAYRLQQREAIINRRGIWANLDAAQAQAYLVDLTPDPLYLAEAADPDGIVYVGDQPTMLVDGAVAFLAFAGAAGWGYYDSTHHWHGAPDRVARHMEHFHPDGHGLRGYGPGGVREAHLGGREGFGGRPGEIGRPGMRGELARGEVGRGEIGRGEIGRGELARGPVGRGEMARAEVGHAQMARAEAARPGVGARPEMGRPAMAPAGARNFAASQPGARPGGAPGGFARPTMASPMARPAAMPAMARAPAARPAAPAAAPRHK